MLYIDPMLMSETTTDIFDGGSKYLTFAAPVFVDDQLRTLFDRAFAHAGPSPECRDAMACETAILCLAARVEVNVTTARRIAKGPTASIRRTQDRIDADPAARLTLGDLADEVGLSRYQLLRGFARELGLTPHAYIVQRRIALARRLIRSGQALAEVAAVAGFFDQSHLTRCFVRQFGVSPGRYAWNAG
jgi:AraC-like DNA-binding protein